MSTKSLLDLHLPVLAQHSFWNYSPALRGETEEKASSSGRKIVLQPAMEFSVRDSVLEYYRRTQRLGPAVKVDSLYSVDFLTDPVVWEKLPRYRGIEGAMDSLATLFPSISLSHLALLKSSQASFPNLALFLVSLEKFFWQKFLPKFSYFNSGQTQGVRYLNLVDYVEKGLLPGSILEGVVREIDREISNFPEEKLEAPRFLIGCADLPDYYLEVSSGKKVNPYFSLMDWRERLSQEDSFFQNHSLIVSSWLIKNLFQAMGDDLDLSEATDGYTKISLYEDLRLFLSGIPLID